MGKIKQRPFILIRAQRSILRQWTHNTSLSPRLHNVPVPLSSCMNICWGKHYKNWISIRPHSFHLPPKPLDIDLLQQVTILHAWIL